jgi:excisionase family DNA binding protein
MDHHTSDVATAAPPTVGQLYTTDEVAKLLRVSQRTVQVWIRDGELTAVRYGRLLRIREADLANFGEVLNQPTPPADQAPEEAPAGYTGSQASPSS